MSKNYDMIATVDIDIASPIVDDTSFDNLLIMGPAPKTGGNVPDVGVYSDITEVTDAGFVVSGQNADSVGVAARVAFAQSPSPTAVYIAVQKLTAGAVVAGGTIRKATAAIEQYAGKKEGLTGCSISFNEAARKLSITLDGPASGVKNTGLFDMVAALIEDGCTATIDGNELTDGASFKKMAVFKEIAAMTMGCEDVTFIVKLSEEGGSEVSYKVVVSYPDPDVPVAASESDGSASVEEPVDSPETELEEPAVTIERALATSGWYVLCSAGIDPAKYEDIAAFVETQEKIFCYTEMGFFGPGKPTVGNVYYRTIGVAGREYSGQPDEEVPEANWYMNVAFVAKWLYYETGSETSAFKALASVYPSRFTRTEMKALEEANLNYFVTVGSKNLTMNGKVMAGEWADIIRFRDWLKNDMQVAVVNVFVTSPKVPYTDSGIALIQNQMLASLKRGQDRGGIAEDEFDEDGATIPGYTTSVPRSSSITAAEKASRKLYRCKFKARLAGAIHFAEITGSLTYEL